MPEQPSNIQLRSEEVQEILSHVPHWLIRWGITVVLMVITILIAASWFIKYPDTVAARVVFTTEVPPVHLVARTNGRLTLRVTDKQQVTKGDILAVIENPASTEDILKLSEALEDIKINIYQKPIRLDNLQLNESWDLGSLQNIYLTFVAVIDDARRFTSISFYKSQREALSSRVKHYEELNQGLKNQMSLIQEEIAISYGIFLDDSVLYEQGAGTKPEMNRSKANYLQNKRNKENLEASIIQNTIQIAQLRAQVDELLLTEEQETGQLQAEIVSAYEKLESEVRAWKQNYLLISPIGGKVAFSKYWADNQFVQAGEEVMTVVPDSEDIIGTVALPVQGSGKVEVGQKVNIKIDNYPSNEYGMVTGQVESMSLVPRDNMYSIRISLVDGLLSTYRKELVFRQEMQGSAEIITEDKRLIERVFNQLRNIIDRVN